MVQRFSAQLYLPDGFQIPVNKNHTDMVKFDSPVDPTYKTVVKHLKECLGTSWNDLHSLVYKEQHQNHSQVTTTRAFQRDPQILQWLTHISAVPYTRLGAVLVM